MGPLWSDCSQQALELAEREVILKEQMNTYGEKFKELQETLTKSNEVFTSFKKDSEKMQKRIKASEKERLVAEKLALKSTKELNEVNEKHEVSLSLCLSERHEVALSVDCPCACRTASCEVIPRCDLPSACHLSWFPSVSAVQQAVPSPHESSAGTCCTLC